jgi:glycosyltransferase involved in cell wall biosynthesis
MTREGGASPTGVLLATDHLEVGGLERLVVDLAQRLAAAGVPVGVLAEGRGALWDDVPGAASRHVLPVGATPLQRYLALRRLLRSGRYRVVHAHQRGIALLSVLAAVRSPVTVVEHVHNVFAARRGTRALSFRGDRLIACGTAITRMLETDFGRPAARIRTVLNGRADPFPGGAPASADDGVLHVLGAGRLTEQKDPQRFVAVLAALADRLGRDRVRATWIGDGELRAATAIAAEEQGVADLLALPGTVDDPRPYLAAADCLLLTSRWEGLPLVALEALAAGRGLVLPDVGSCADAVSDEVGLLYDGSADAATIADLLAAASTDGRMVAWRAPARERFLTRFTADRWFEQVAAVYAELGSPVDLRPGAVAGSRS